MSKVTIDPTKVRNAGTDIMSLENIIRLDNDPRTRSVSRVYQQSYWYAMGRMDGETGGKADHTLGDLFGRGRATARHRMDKGEVVSNGSMTEDYEAAREYVYATV